MASLRIVYVFVFALVAAGNILMLPLNFSLYEISEQLLSLSRWGQQKIGRAATTRRGTPISNSKVKIQK